MSFTELLSFFQDCFYKALDEAPDGECTIEMEAYNDICRILRALMIETGHT